MKRRECVRILYVVCTSGLEVFPSKRQQDTCDTTRCIFLPRIFLPGYLWLCFQEPGNFLL